MIENFSNYEKKRDIEVQIAHKVSNKIKPKRFAERHIVIKMEKIVDKNN